jgi:hypothetical protein
MHDLERHDTLRLAARTEDAGDEVARGEQAFEFLERHELRQEVHAVHGQTLGGGAVGPRAADERQPHARRRGHGTHQGVEPVQRHARAEEQEFEHAIGGSRKRRHRSRRARVVHGQPRELLRRQAGQLRDVGGVLGSVEQHEIRGCAGLVVDAAQPLRQQRARSDETTVFDDRVVNRQEKVEHDGDIDGRREVLHHRVPWIRHEHDIGSPPRHLATHGGNQRAAFAALPQPRRRPAPRLAHESLLAHTERRRPAFAHASSRGGQPLPQGRRARIAGAFVPGAGEQHVSVHSCGLSARTCRSARGPGSAVPRSARR